MKEQPSLIKDYYYSEPKGNQNLSRYRVLKRLINEDGDNYIETPNKMIFKESNDDNLYEVESGMENRIDLVSYKFYGTPLLWWVIAYINHIDDPTELEVGVILRIPKRDRLGV